MHRTVALPKRDPCYSQCWACSNTRTTTPRGSRHLKVSAACRRIAEHIKTLIAATAARGCYWVARAVGRRAFGRRRSERNLLRLGGCFGHCAASSRPTSRRWSMSASGGVRPPGWRRTEPLGSGCSATNSSLLRQFVHDAQRAGASGPPLEQSSQRLAGDGSPREGSAPALPPRGADPRTTRAPPRAGRRVEADGDIVYMLWALPRRAP